MKKFDKPYHILFEIGLLIRKKHPNYNDMKKTINIYSEDFEKLVSQFNKFKEFHPYQFSYEEIIIIACTWNEFVTRRDFDIDPIKILFQIFCIPKDSVQHMDDIIKLLKKNVFYTEKKEVILKKRGSDKTKSTVNFKKYSLMENDIEFHRSFVQLLLGEMEDIELFNKRPYESNKEFIDDWFSYVEKLYEYSSNNFASRVNGLKWDNSEFGEFLDTLQWRARIESRLKETNITFPLMDLADEYNLDDNEVTILMHLVREELEDLRCDTEEIVRLISTDYHDMMLNKKYVSIDSRLVKYGLIELSEGLFFMTSGSSVRVSPDITRRIIMKTPVNDDERLEQILQGNDIFMLVEPTQTFNDLILADEMKKTIKYAINQYKKDVDNILDKWGLYDGGMEIVGRMRNKMESGMLMLFYGPPGTGKTFAAGSIARALGKKLLITDVSRIQSKWVGDSEKNVRRMFTIFERVVRRVDNPPVLLLNEADQFLTKRLNNTNSSVDKMFNSLQNLFLEAFENLRGILIATTNLRGNLDEAFSRRFHLKLEFPFPELDEKAELWKLHLPSTIPGSDKIDIDTLAGSFKLSGGQIKIIVSNACAEAASRNGVNRQLLQRDLIKYCEIETGSSFEKRNTIGF